MQAGGVVSYGLQALMFLGNFMFDFSLLERLGYVMLWIVHGGILGHLNVLTVLSYLVVAAVKFEESPAVKLWCIWTAFAVYLVVQVGLMILSLYYLKDTIMYMVAGEIKDICENYGELCSEYGVLEKKQGSSEEIEGTSLSSWNWDY